MGYEGALVGAVGTISGVLVIPHLVSDDVAVSSGPETDDFGTCRVDDFARGKI